MVYNIGFGTIHRFRHPREVLEGIPHRQGGDYYILEFPLLTTWKYIFPEHFYAYVCVFSLIENILHKLVGFCIYTEEWCQAGLLSARSAALSVDLLPAGWSWGLCSLSTASSLHPSCLGGKRFPTVGNFWVALPSCLASKLLHQLCNKSPSF